MTTPTSAFGSFATGGVRIRLAVVQNAVAQRKLRLNVALVAVAVRRSRTVG
jgi:hypothetical protein